MHELKGGGNRVAGPATQAGASAEHSITNREVPESDRAGGTGAYGRLTQLQQGSIWEKEPI